MQTIPPHLAQKPFHPRLETLPVEATLGEGSLWDDRFQVLWWIDILNSTLYRYDPATGENRAFDVGSHIGTVGLLGDQELIIATFEGIMRFNPETGARQLIANPEVNLTRNRYNDGKPGPDGSFYIGSMEYDGKEGEGALYRLNRDGRIRTLVNRVTISNGLAWNAAENSLFYIDTPTGRIDRFEYDRETGQISNRRPAVEIPEWAGHPDGMTIDGDDTLWVAHFSGSAVHRWDPESGAHLESIQLPVSNVTSCTFGGEAFNQLYITTARVGLSDDALAAEPLAGSLFRITLNQRGRPAYRYLPARR